MNCPEGLLCATDKDALKLQKCIYGLVQGARQYHKKMVEVLKSIGFKGGDVDSCLYANIDENEDIYVALYVDGILLVGNKNTIGETIKVLKRLVFY